MNYLLMRVKNIPTYHRIDYLTNTPEYATNNSNTKHKYQERSKTRRETVNKKKK